MLGGINLYITGVTILENIVELINPPINTIANGEISGLGFQARGINPQIAVMDVSTAAIHHYSIFQKKPLVKQRNCNL